jgi:chromosome segregation ATPase
MRGFSKVFGFGFFLVAAAAPSMAVAGESNAEVCHAQLEGLDDARAALDQLEDAVATAKAERAQLKVRDAELAAEIALADGAQRDALVAERTTVQAELAAIADLLPAIEAQAVALRAELDSAERAYIGCIEATIE